MTEFIGFGKVLRRCKLDGIIGLVVGSPSQLEIRNTRAMEILRGMMKQPENSGLTTYMQIEWEFLKAREKYLKTGKLKSSLLKRALHIAKDKCGEDSDFIQFIDLRCKAYTAYANVKTDKEIIKQMNEIVEKVSIKPVRNTLLTEITPSAEYSYTFEGVPLVFHDEDVMKQFKEMNYKNVIRKLRGKTDFDSMIVAAVARVEKFRDGMQKLEKQNDKTSKKTLLRYMSQWNSIYTTTIDLFSANYMDEDYLHKINKEISYIPQNSSILFHPVTYDISSLYVDMPQEIPTRSAGLSGMLSRMSLFRR
ncbi:hypothetical protein NEIRO03_1874 [Nematocida sp. AWRm78]|nr:hypothetical protein NEIRO02_1898 [Nematocida sp. AWRm79]KAI5184869.1 hypothetical protein NEIRO03_1874 [Nematocida sp. AWRm78]